MSWQVKLSVKSRRGRILAYLVVCKLYGLWPLHLKVDGPEIVCGLTVANAAGMSRDKCGAAATAGLMASIAALQPQGVKVGMLRFI